MLSMFGIIRVIAMLGKLWACVVSADFLVLETQPRAAASFTRVRGKRERTLEDLVKAR